MHLWGKNYNLFPKLGSKFESNNPILEFLVQLKSCTHTHTHLLKIYNNIERFSFFTANEKKMFVMELYISRVRGPTLTYVKMQCNVYSVCPSVTWTSIQLLNFSKYCAKVDRWKSRNRLTNSANINKDNAKKNNLNDFILNITQMLMLVNGIILILIWLRGVQIWRQRAYFEISKYDKFLHTSDEKLDRKSIY